MADPMQMTSVEAPASTIENELGGYRAISGWAIASMLLGLLGILSFASRSFLVVTAAAVVTGAIGLRMISRFPSMLTGRGLANFGIGLGLVCGLSSFTVTFIESRMVEREAKRFGQTFCEVLNNGQFADVFFLHLPAAERKGRLPEVFLREIQEKSGPQFEADPRSVAINDLKSRLARSPQETTHLVKVEGQGRESMTPVAFVSIELDGPEADKDPNFRHALLVLNASKLDGRREWHVKEIRFPYKSDSLSKTVESAHGHDH